MPKAIAKNITTAATIDPVIELSKKLLVLWDADNGSQTEYSELGEKIHQHVQDDTMGQFAEWRDALEKIITYTEPRSLQGALVQMALACDTLHDLEDFLENGDAKAINCRVLQLDRLLYSAMRAIRSSLGTEIDPTVRSLGKIYSSDHTPNWIDHVKDWSDRGRASRQQDDIPDARR